MKGDTEEDDNEDLILSPCKMSGHVGETGQLKWRASNLESLSLDIPIIRDIFRYPYQTLELPKTICSQ